MAANKKDQKWEAVDAEIRLIESFKNIATGTAVFKGNTVGAELDRKNGFLVFRLGTIVDNTLNDDIDFAFNSNGLDFKISGNTTAHRNTVKVKEGWASRYTEGKVDEIKSAKWRKSDGCFRSYYAASGKNLLYHIFENRGAIELNIDSHSFCLFQEEYYVVVESINDISFEAFSEISYSLLVALGFVSGEFLQGEVFAFRVSTRNNALTRPFSYRTLRKGGTSIYQALIWNPFGYAHYTGRAFAEKMYKRKTLKPLNNATFTELVELTFRNHQIKYALVLFNDANESTQSLLIRNNCFFTVLEVLKKFFYEVVKDRLPNIYSQRGNIEKFKIIFEMIAPISEEEAVTLAKRNTFLHGDIKDIEGEEMMEVMLKQIALIHKLVMTYIGFSGHVIDHYYLRNGPPEKAYVLVNGELPDAD